MKKKLFVLLLSIISVVCLAFGVSACSKTKTDDIAVTSVSISTTEISLEVGESYTLSATILPSNATNTSVTWSSSATSVATVSGGKVTAISEGTAVITVITTDGGYTDTCSVTVTETQETPTTVSVTSVSLSETSLSLEAGGTYTLTATVLPSNATDKTVSWSSSDESVAIVNNGIITAVAAGTATITVTTTDGNYTATCELTITEEPATVAVTSVTLDKSTLALTVGDEYTLTATISPSNATNQNITWASSDKSVATVSNGLVTAVSAGTATITVTTEDGNFKDTCTVTVEEETPATVTVTGVTLDKATLTLAVGDTYTLTATISPSDATNKNVSWSSFNESVVTVENGKLTAISTGTAVVIVTTEDGGKLATCTVTVNEATVSVTSITLNNTTLTLNVGNTSTLVVTILPNNATNQNATWASSDDTVATVSDGVVTAIDTGTATITVTTEDGSYTAKCEVTVSETVISVTSVSLNTNSLSLTVGGNSTLIATVLPTNATNQNVTWASSDDAVATVSDGVVTAIAAGTTTITVTTADGNYKAECAVTVKEETPTTVAVTSVTIDKTTLELEVGDTYTLTATILPSNATNQNITWSSTNESAAIVENGKITAVAAGAATITVTTEDGGYTATCSVTVTDPIVSVTSVTLSDTSLTLEKGANYTLTATILPYNATNQNVTWGSSDENIVTVSNGVITAVGTGTATITVTTADGNYTATCEVTVITSVASVELNATTLTLEKGDTYTLIATVLPSDATNKNVTWSSSDNSVVSLSDGVLTAVGIGTATITVTTVDGNYAATCEITVIISVTSVTISESSLTLEKGSTHIITTTVLPNNAINQAVTWSSSDNSVVTVYDGIITAVDAGTATITVTTVDGNYSATCEVTVIISATSVSLSDTSLTLEKGSTYTLTATILPSNATNQNVTWSSSNQSVVTVNDGKITAIGAGTATITVATEDGSCTATCQVTVIISTTSIELSETSLTLEKGESYTLIAKITPSDSTDQNITWASSNSNVVTVENGKITAISTGTAAITAYAADGTLTATCEVTVTISVTSVSLSDTAVIIEKGESYTLTATVAPSDALNQNVTWNSSNTSVATVSGGVITAVSAGTAIITVTTADGGYTATCTVSVTAIKAEIVSVNNATLTDNQIYMVVDYTTSNILLSSSVICSDNCSWKLYASDAITEIPTKVITSLADGYNTYYIVVTSTKDTSVQTTYFLTIYKSFAVTVSYYNGLELLYAETAYTGYDFTTAYIPEITGYTFNYWETYAGEEYSTTIIYADLVLFANTTANTYNVTYDTNGGSIEGTGKTVTYDSSYYFDMPSRAGYTFNGWYYSDIQLTDENGDSLLVWYIPDNITVTAKWTANDYDVTLYLSDSNAGSVSGAGSHTYDNEVTISASTNDGYTWVGWYDDTDTLVTSETSYTFTMGFAVSYTAKWTANSYTITLELSDTNAGSVTGDGSHTYNTKVTISATTNNGYTWVGWADEYGDIVETKESYSFTMGFDTTYTAMWYANEYEVTLNLSDDNAGLVTGNGLQTYNAKVTITATTNEGYTWVGWYDDSDTLVTSETSYTFTMGFAVSYTAKWTANKYTITLYRSDDNAGSVEGGDSYEYNTQVTITAIANDGYTWDGWYKDGKRVSTEESYTFIMGFDAAYTATWTANEYTVTIDLFDSSSGTVTGDGDHTYNTEVIITAETNDGYTWVGWYDSNGEQVTTNTSYTFTMGFDVTYTAKWTYYTVTTAINDTSAGTITEYTDLKVTVGNTVEITAVTNDGYTWLGWYDENGKQLTDALTYSFTMSAESVTYTAKWTYYTVTTAVSDTDAGSITEYTDFKVTVGNTIEITAVTNDGYTWLGWYDESGKQLTDALTYSFTMQAESVTYTAKWTYYTLTTAVNDTAAGTITEYSETKITVGNYVTVTAETNDGYMFLGWYNGEKLLSTDLSYTFAMPAENVTYIANWMACPVTLEKNIDEAGEVGGVSTTIVDEKVTITATSNEGYNFNGWYNGETLLTTELTYTFTITTESVTYTANWTIGDYTLSLELSHSDAGTVTGDGTYTYKNEVIITASTNEGFTWIGWYTQSGDLVSSDSKYTFNMGIDTTYIATWSKTTLAVNNSAAGSVSTLASAYVLGESVTITVTETNLGYTFVGWYNGETLLTTETEYTFKMSAEDIEFTAVFAVSDEMSNFTFTSTTTTCEITSIADSTVTEVVIPDYVTSIASGAFKDCISLVKATIGSGVTSIGSNAFYGCYKLIEVYNLSALELTAGDSDYGYAACYAKNVYTDSDGNTNLVHSDSGEYIFYHDTDKYYLMAYIGTDTYISLPDDIDYQTYNIYNYAFYNNTSLTSVDTCYGTLNIGDYAFYGCTSLTSVTIGGNVMSIGNYAFYGCTSIESVSVTDLVVWCNDVKFNNAYDNPLYYAGNLYINGELVTDLVITDEVHTIGAYAFYGCTSITSVTIPDTVKTIGSTAFGGCTSLESVTIGNGVTTIGSYTFENCSAEIIWGENLAITEIGSYAFAYYAGTNITIPETVTSIGDYAFYGCTSIESIIVPDTVTSIGSAAFGGCSSLVSITLPFVGGSVDATSASASTLFGYIFGTDSYDGGTAAKQYYASSSYITYYIPTNLTTVTITGGDIFYGAFYNCTTLANIAIPDSLTSIIGDVAFYNTAYYNDTSNWENNVLYLDNYLITAKTSISGGYTIKDGTTVIADYAFYNCRTLTNVTIPDGVTSIGDSAFYYCFSLTSVTIPDSVTSIGDSAFYYCDSLTSIAIPDSVASIGSYAFYYCTLLASMTIPDSVFFIGDCAFWGCTGLTSITIPDGVTSIGIKAFYDCTSLESITIGESVTSIGDYAFCGCTSLTSVYITDLAAWCNISFGNTVANPLYYAGNLYLNGELITDLVIPDSVTSIGDYAFRSCISLVSITIPDSVTFIGNYAFRGCSSITSVTIPKNVTYIGDYAFSDCLKLLEVYNLSSLDITAGSEDNGYVAYYAKNVYTSSDAESGLFDYGDYTFTYGDDGNYYLVAYNGSGSEITLPEDINGNSYSIYNYAFYGCTSLTSIVIPDGVTSIGDYAFYGCSSLESVIIGSAITTIGNYALYGCSALTSITIGGSVTSIGDYAFYGCSSLESVVVPDSVTSIGSAAFGGCSSLVSITLPFVGSSADATSASSSTLFGYIFGTSSYTGGTFVEQYYSGNSTSSGSSSTKYISYCIPTTLTTVTITNGKILYGSFYGCTSLTDITIGNNVTSIGSLAFKGCTSLSSITIGNSVTSIGQYAFQSCSAKIVWLSDVSITNIGSYSFAFYSGTSVTIPSSVTSINSDAFYYCRLLTSITIPDSVTSIGSSAFYGCTSLESVTIPDSVTSIGSYAFYGCTSLESITIPNSVTSINEYTFYNCTSLENVIIGSNITSIGRYAFYNTGYYNNQDNWQDSVLYIDNYLIVADTSISGDYTIKENTSLLAAYAFYNCASLTSVFIPESVTSIGNYAFYNCTALTEILFNATAVDDLSSSNYVFYKAGQNGEGITVTIGANVTKIPAYLFYPYSSSSYAPNIISVVFEDGSVCTSIGSYVFRYCTSLESVFIPKSVTSIGNYAFTNCSCIIFAEAESKPSGWNSYWNSSNCSVLWGLSSIPTETVTYTFVTNSGSTVDSITAIYLLSLPATSKDGYAFGGWYADEDLTVKVTAPYYSSTDVTLYAKWYDITTQSEGLEIEDGVVVGIGTCTDTVLYICMPIAASAFKGCTQITTVYLYDGCTSVGSQAFYSCTNLTAIYFYQTEMPELGSDIFGNVWNASSFGVYVLADLYDDYYNSNAGYWQTYIVNMGKLYTIE